MGTQINKCTIISGAPDDDIDFLKENIDLQNNNNKLVGTTGNMNSNRSRTNSLLSKLGIGGKKNVQD